jgi:hypothetical protein
MEEVHLVFRVHYVSVSALGGIFIAVLGVSWVRSYSVVRLLLFILKVFTLGFLPEAHNPRSYHSTGPPVRTNLKHDPRYQPVVFQDPA